MSHSDQRHGEHDAEADDARHRKESDAEVNDIEGIVEVERARIGAKGIEQHVLDHHREPERHQQDVAVLAVGGRTNDEALQAVTQREEQRREHHGREIRVEPEEPVREERREHGGGEQRAVREIDDVQDAVDQRQPERYEPIDRAGQEPVEDGGNEDDRRQHAATERATAAAPPSFCAQAGGMGNTGFAVAKVCGKITWMSLPSTWVLTGAAPWFWPSTNLVGP